MKHTHNWIDLSKYLPVLVIILIVFLALPISYYFLYALPHHNKQMLDIEIEKQKQMITNKDTQLSLEKEKLEIQNRETTIKEEANQRQTDETNRKLKILSEQKAEVAECDKKISDYMEESKKRAIESCEWKATCYISDTDAQILSLWIGRCADLREKYNL